jgi:mono/diheme cytochrome c family protein
MGRKLFPGLLAALLLGACAQEQETVAPAPESASFDTLMAGARLFDMWYDESEAAFIPDDEETPEIDGSGGPNGNGTLNGPDGLPIGNDGHDYRFKNLFGWDMRGDAGIYGREHQAKAWVLATGPLSAAHTRIDRAEWIDRLSNGWAGLPAYGEVLTVSEIASLVDFMLAVRDGQLPRPDDLYALNVDAPRGFILAAGGNSERGHALYAEQCADCHGADATKIIFDDGEQSLGQHARYFGYAVAMITLAGEPGSEMQAQPWGDLSVAEQTQNLLDLLAALCDRERYPRGAGSDPEVPDDDPRCREYLR